MSEMSTELEAPDATLSSDARDSTYEAATDLPEQNPPSGPQVVQTLGQVKAAKAAAKTTKASTKEA